MVKLCNAICQGSDDYRENGWKRKVDIQRVGKPCTNPAKRGYDKCPSHLKRVNAWIDSGIFEEWIKDAERSINDLSKRK